jgi:hypothetical protein
MINYLIIAHKNPDQVLRLINTLRLNDDNHFFIHIDYSQDISEFQRIINGADITYSKNRYHCVWAHYNFVLATIKLLKLVFEKARKGKIILLSGQCYPVKKIEEINKFLKDDDGLSYMDIGIPGWRDFQRRITEYRIDFSNERYDYIYLKTFNLHSLKLWLKGKINIAQLLRLLKKRKIDLEFRGGSAWWVLDYNTANTLYHYYLRNKRKLDSFFIHSHCPDEFFWQTLAFKIWGGNVNQLFKPSLLYVNWSRKNVPLPVTFTQSDFIELANLSNNYLFARKFDYDVDSIIFNLIDRNIMKQ